MGSEFEKVYVAVGNDVQDGIKTLEWTLKRWSSHPISIVILHVTFNSSKDFVYTPFGKLPASAVSDEKLGALKKYEETKIEKMFSLYMAICREVKVEIMKIEKHDETIHKLVLELIIKHQISKLVIGITFIKSPLWKEKNAVSSLFNINQNRPEYCEFFVISGGKMVYLKGDNEDGVMEDDQGATLVKMREKGSRKNWISIMFPNNNSFSSPSLGRTNSRISSTSSSKRLDSPVLHNQWESYAEEIENYFQHLLSMNLDNEKFDGQDDGLQITPTDPAEYAYSNKNVAERMEMVKTKINEAQEKVELKKKEAKVSAERYTKADWAKCLCNTRVQQLDILIKEEVQNRTETQKSIDRQKEQLEDTIRDIEESKNKLNSIIQLQAELSNKLNSSSMAKLHVESQLDHAIVAREDLVREIEDLRRQRDVLHRRIEFCKEKDAIGKATEASEMSYGFRKYTADDIRFATDDFSERLRLKSGGGEESKVYRGRINHSTVAIKMLNDADGLSEEDFQAKVKLLINIRHPNLVSMMGFCLELKCLVYEYMHNGNLADLLFSTRRRYSRGVKWHDRIRVAQEVCSGLGFLYLAEPRPIVHGNLTPSKILLDRYLVAKTTGFGLNGPYEESALRSDIQAFGELLWNLLTGKKWAGPNEVMKLDRTALGRILDKMAGKWPLDLAEEIVGIVMMCFSNEDLSIGDVMERLEEVKKKGDGLVEKEKYEMMTDRDTKKDESNSAPGVFICPINQEVMKNPYVAADGFSYEQEAIEEWLMGHDTSPMTNLKLNDKLLTPNHTLRNLIQDWQGKTSTKHEKGRKTKEYTK